MYAYCMSGYVSECEDISCPLGVVEQYKGCLHTTDEEYAHSLAHYCCYGCNIALTCIFGIQL